MSRSFQLYTSTMAKLYADQGYYRKAAEVYRHLLYQNPERNDLRQALSAVEEQIARQQTPNWKELGLLVSEWADLIREYNRRRRSTEKEAS